VDVVIHIYFNNGGDANLNKTENFLFHISTASIYDYKFI